MTGKEGANSPPGCAGPFRTGRMLQLFDQPVNLFVAGFIGSPAMNLVTARLNGGAGQATVSFA